MKKMGFLTVVCLGFCLISIGAFAESYTANFTAKPPVIDGKVSAGEWDAAAAAITKFTAHDSETDQDPKEKTKVRVLYSLKGIYVLYECTDTLVQSVVTGSEEPGNGGGWTFANTDYTAIYIDPANVSNDQTDPDVNTFSYSIQVEPSRTANAADDTYTYTEFGRWGGCTFRNPDATAEDRWLGGGAWQLKESKIFDAKSADGYAMEFFIAWSDLNLPYYQHFGSTITENAITLIGAEATLRQDPTAYWGLAAVDGGNVTGMPLPGKTWKIQFCRHSASSEPQYVNWVGATGGFVSRPFGDLVFGEVTTAQIQDAMLYQ